MDLDPDSDPDPVIFVSDLQDVYKKSFIFYFAIFYLLNYFVFKFFCLLFFECKFTSFFTDKRHKEVTKQ
jgi:hypothetical protein